MKQLLFLLFLFIADNSIAQYIIIDPAGGIKKTSNISIASATRDLVIYESDLDTVIAISEKYKALIKTNKASFVSREEKAGNSLMKVHTKRVGAVDRYRLIIETTINGTTYKRQLTDIGLTNGENVKKLEAFISQVKQASLRQIKDPADAGSFSISLQTSPLSFLTSFSGSHPAHLKTPAYTGNLFHAPHLA